MSRRVSNDSHNDEQQLENSVSSVLFDLIPDDTSRSDALCRISSHPREARYVDKWTGATPLHEACWGGISSELVSALLEVYPEATMIRNQWGRTPLHIAVVFQTDEVVKKLLRANSATTDLTDRRNRTPLEHLCWSFTVPARAGSGVSDGNGKAVANEEDEMDQFLRSRRDGEKFRRFWRFANMLVKAQRHDSVDDDDDVDCDKTTFRLVHSCAGIRRCPTLLLRLAIDTHPEQLCQMDESGNMPLHIASMVQPEFCDHESCEGGSGRSRVQTLVKAFPGAAKIRNAKGSLPLHLAVKSKKGVGVVTTLLEAFPGAVACKDGPTRLYPFVLASLEYSSAAKSSTMPLSSLDMMYQLLRSCPELERFGCRFSSTPDQGTKCDITKKKRKRDSSLKLESIFALGTQRMGTKSMSKMTTEGAKKRKMILCNTC